MATLVSLRAVVDEIEMLGDEGIHAFLNRQTGELYSGTDEQLSKAGECDDEELLDWEVEVIHRLREVQKSPEWLELPRRDSHEDYNIMERFCLERCEGRLQEELLSAITGRGAFGRFKETLFRQGIREAWFAFRRESIASDAREWLVAHEIGFES